MKRKKQNKTDFNGICQNSRGVKNLKNWERNQIRKKAHCAAIHSFSVLTRYNSYSMVLPCASLKGTLPKLCMLPSTSFSSQSDSAKWKARNCEQPTCNVMLLILVASIPEIWTFCPTRLAASCNCIPSRVAKLPSVKDTVKSPPATKENSYIIMFFFIIGLFVFIN